MRQTRPSESLMMMMTFHCDAFFVTIFKRIAKRNELLSKLWLCALLMSFPKRLFARLRVPKVSKLLKIILLVFYFISPFFSSISSSFYFSCVIFLCLINFLMSRIRMCRYQVKERGRTDLFSSFMQLLFQGIPVFMSVLFRFQVLNVGYHIAKYPRVQY